MRWSTWARHAGLRSIVAIANERGADHLVIGTHGREAMKRLLLGRVASGHCAGIERLVTGL
jgi:universal stress protein family protein